MQIKVSEYSSEGVLISQRYWFWKTEPSFTVGPLSNGSAVGEVVFNTSMTGYQEILTDPSYSRQIVTLTIPILVMSGVQ